MSLITRNGSKDGSYCNLELCCLLLVVIKTVRIALEIHSFADTLVKSGLIFKFFFIQSEIFSYSLWWEWIKGGNWAKEVHEMCLALMAISSTTYNIT